MRRVHPQRSKPPVRPQNNSNSSNKLSTGNSNINHENKAWTTHSELYRRYAVNNNNNSGSSNALQQAVTQAKQAKPNSMAGRKSFAFNPSSILQTDQGQDANATNMEQTTGVLSSSNNKDHSGSEAEGGDKAGASTWNKGRVVVGGNDDDDDVDDFDLPDFSELFANSLPRKLRRVENSGNKANTAEATTSRTHGHQQTSSCQSKDKVSHTNRTHSDDKIKRLQVEKREEEEDDPWVMSIHTEDQDLELFPPSPTSSFGGIVTDGDNQKRLHQPQKQLHQKLLPAMSTRSEVSQTQQTLNEIDKLFVNESVMRSSGVRLETPLEDDEMSENRSPTPYVGAPNQFPSLTLRNMDESGVGDAALLQEHQKDDKMEANIAINVDGQNDAGVVLTGDSGMAHAEATGEQSIDPHQKQDASDVANKALSEVASQASDGNASERQTLKFTLPNSSEDFHMRLQQLSSSFQSSLDDMMGAIKDVELFRSTVEKTLTNHQDVLHQRGERIHEQARRLHDEATILHSKGRQDMLRAVRSN
ncbi:hypothetical protein EC991_004172 [Linnemannia zychae]|nr:hypothetical protein EC991_004172 [Linnemannia zychae]